MRISALNFHPYFIPLSSSYLLVVMAVDRYGAICYPMRQRRRAWRPRDSRRRVAQVWALALALCTPQAIVFGGDGDGDGDGGVGCAAKFHDGAWCSIFWRAKMRSQIQFTCTAFARCTPLQKVQKVQQRRLNGSCINFTKEDDTDT